MTDVGSGTSTTTIVATASGDAVVDAADRWVMTNGTNAPHPTVTLVGFGPNAQVTPTGVVHSDGDEIAFSYTITVPAGDTTVLAWFTTMHTESTIAQEQVEIFNDPVNQNLFVGLPPDVLCRISNFAVTTSTASGDPHLAGAHGIKFDVFGKPAANYSLLVAPAFEINMQLANRGPEMRFMTAMSVLYKGKSFVITPWTLKGKRAQLIAHFEALGAKVSIDTHKWTITIELCAQHTIVFATHHSDGINYLNFELSVPGCHDAYGGLLGQTYQCKYAHEKFEWSREREEAFRVAALETASDMYAPLAECAHEDEYRGEAIRGGSFSNSTLSMTTML